MPALNLGGSPVGKLYLGSTLITDGSGDPPLDPFATQMASYSWDSWLRLDESSGTNANDQTSNNRDGTYNGTPTFSATSLVDGDANAAVNFDATGDFVTVPTLTHGATDFTVVFGFSTTRTTNSFLFSNYSAAGKLEIPMEGASGRVRADWWDAAGGYTSAVVNDGAPHIAVATWRATPATGSLWVDGVLSDRRFQSRGSNALTTTSHLNRRSGGTLPGIAVFDEWAIGGFLMTDQQVEDLSAVFLAAP
jgi:hypothetical protein